MPPTVTTGSAISSKTLDYCVQNIVNKLVQDSAEAAVTGKKVL